MFDINKFRNVQIKNDRYSNQIRKIRAKGYEYENIDATIEESIRNIIEGYTSFVIYGEPQCGKTEMMISLTARLLDEGFKKIIILVNDNVSLLGQNLIRFRNSEINPTPVNYVEILDEEVKDKEMIIFCKKNKNDLEKLLFKLEGQSKLVIIDDEADYATPNSKINRNERTTINRQIYELLMNDGLYIGVTATPARLDLNNTHDNLTEKWVRFQPHKNYVGMNEFFPLDGIVDSYNLRILPDSDDSPKYLRNAIFSFLVNVSYLNCLANLQGNYSMLIHTSGNKVDHTIDYKNVIKTFDVLLDRSNPKWDKYIQDIYEIANNRYGDKEADTITCFIIENLSRKTVAVMNSDKKFDIDPTQPPSLFTVAIGGNIVSRGVTFENLLSMFFTRDVRHKLQQDTYIQRARMFGNRKKYLQFFELLIPTYLYNDWRRCFVYHHLALKMIEHDKKAPFWMGDERIQPVGHSSIDRSTVNINSGEMTFNKFKWDNRIDQICNNVNGKSLVKLNQILGDVNFPKYIVDFINSTSKNDSDIAVTIRGVKPSSNYHESLLRTRGVFGGQDVENHPNAIHHIMLLKNTNNEGRVVYKFTGKKITSYKNRN